MQINKVNLTSNFGATIKNTKALKEFVTSLCDGFIDRYGQMPREEILKNFARIHEQFPQASDTIVFTKHIDLAYGHPADNHTCKVVEGFVKSEGKKANFAFTYDWREFLPAGYYMRKMHNAFCEAANTLKKNDEHTIIDLVLSDIVKKK